jgi:hypothetical protein
MAPPAPAPATPPGQAKKNVVASAATAVVGGAKAVGSAVANVITSVPVVGGLLGWIGKAIVWVLDKVTLYLGLQHVASALKISVQYVEVLVVAGLVAIGCYLWGDFNKQAEVDRTNAAFQTCQKKLLSAPMQRACPSVAQAAPVAPAPLLSAPPLTLSGPAVKAAANAPAPAAAAPPAASVPAPATQVAKHMKRRAAVKWWDPFSWQWPSLSFKAAAK